VCDPVGNGFSGNGGIGTGWLERLEKGLGIKDWVDKFLCIRSCRQCSKDVKKNTPDPNDPDWLNKTLQNAQNRQDNGQPAASVTVNVVSQSGAMFPASESCLECAECGVSTAVTGGIPSP